MKNKKPIIEVVEIFCEKQSVMYVENENFYIFNNDEGIWQQQSEQRLKLIIATFAGSYYKSNQISNSLIKEFLEMLRIFCVTPKDFQFNSDRRFIPLQNGIYEIETGQLLDFSENYFFTYSLPIKFDNNADCKRWKQFIEEVTNKDKSLILVLQEFIGYCLTASVKHEKALLLFGTGANGKSVLLETLQYIFGKENIGNIPFHSLGSAFSLVHLNNRLVNISSEISTKGLANTSVFKQIVSGDTVSACYKFKDNFSFRPIVKLLFSGNALPRINDRSDGILRRLIIVPFEVEFHGKQRDKDLKNKLKAEADGIFLWALEGLKRLNEQNGFSQSKIIDNILEQYKKEVNPLLSFIEEECELNESLKIEKKCFRDEYAQWCKDSGYLRLSDVQLSKELIRLGCRLSKSGAKRYFVGINFINKAKLDEEHRIEMAKQGKAA